MKSNNSEKLQFCVWEDCDQAPAYCEGHAHELVNPLSIDIRKLQAANERLQAAILDFFVHDKRETRTALRDLVGGFAGVDKHKSALIERMSGALRDIADGNRDDCPDCKYNERAAKAASCNTLPEYNEAIAAVCKENEKLEAENELLRAYYRSAEKAQQYILEYDDVGPGATAYYDLLDAKAALNGVDDE